MKFQVKFKTPDISLQIEAEACNHENKDYVLNSLFACTNRFIEYDEYITVEFDTETKTAVVVPLVLDNKQ